MTYNPIKTVIATGVFIGLGVLTCAVWISTKLSLMAMLLWIFDWPDWLLAAVVILATTALFLAGWKGYLAWLEPHTRKAHLRRRFQHWIAPNCRFLEPKPWPALVSGFLMGTLVVLSLAEPWNAFVVDSLMQLPPTAAGPASQQPLDASVITP